MNGIVFCNVNVDGIFFLHCVSTFFNWYNHFYKTFSERMLNWTPKYIISERALLLLLTCTDKNDDVFGTVIARNMQLADLDRGGNDESESKMTSGLITSWLVYLVW